MSEIDRTEGRHAFGADPLAYASGRPGYPQRVYDLLRERCGLRSGTVTFEIGPGTGQATRRLLEMGAAPLVAIEPDARLATYLAHHLDGVEVRRAAFEEVELDPASFDLGVAATSFHWLEQQTALAKVARALRPGGWWAVCWNVFGDPSRPDPFHEATQGVLGALRQSPSTGPSGSPPFALDFESRVGDLQSAGEFEDIAHETIRWTANLDSDAVRRLFSTFSEVTRLPDERRRQLLDDLARIMEERFGGRVEKPVVTAVYTARRR